MDAVERAIAAHHVRWQRPPDVVVRAPGRVNLIGEHTDYNDGYALPMALPFDTAIASSDDGDPVAGAVTVSSAGFGDVVVDPSNDPREVESWARHLAGVVSLLAERGIPAAGWRATIDTDIPTGASLSSSAALEVAAITALLARSGIDWPPLEVARVGQRVENEVVGLPSGIMDQFISAGAIAGRAGLLDCRALTLRPVALPAGVAIVVLDTGTRRVLAGAAYAQRRDACARAAAALGVPALRDAGLDDVARLTDAEARRRARHVVSENLRVLAAVEAMRSGDVVTLGQLMSRSHESLRDDFEVSGPGLDAIVEVAGDAPGCLGARMTGGGFAGCAVALVDEAAVEAFDEFVRTGYRFGGHRARLWACRPAPGAEVLTGRA